MTTTTFDLSAVKLQHGTFYTAVWGCQMNVYDGERISDLLCATGLQQLATPQGADVIVLITCAVRAKAEDKVFNQLLSWRHQGIINDHTIIALGGCVGAELAQKIIELSPDVNIVFGPRTAHRLPQLIRKFKTEGVPQIAVEADALEKFDALPEQGARGVSAFVTIMEGCSNKCSYCIVPYTRGEEESRPLESIIAEVQGHIAHGVKEIHLLGQNVNSYRGLDENGHTVHFSTLLYAVAAVEGVERIRFTTSNPMEFTDDIIEAIADLPLIANHVHIPVQSGSDRILQLMRRHYRADDYRHLIAKIRAVRPNIHVSSDFIVGFPGETDEDFAHTMQLARDIGFDQSFSFIYSKRPGTPAALMDDPTPLEVKKERLYQLQALLEESAATIAKSLDGTVQEVLVEGTSRKNSAELKARASSNHIVVFEGSPELIGQMVRVKITQVMAHTLKGELVHA